MRGKNTLSKEIHLSGIGIHSGKQIDLRLKPSSSGGILFRRTDLGNAEVNLDIKNIKAKNSTYIETKRCRIQTLEHLLAVFYVFGIDCAEVEMNGEEIPIMDGSAAPFVEAVQRAGIQPLPDQIEFFHILKPYSIKEEDAFFSFSPGMDLKISYSIEYDHPLIQKQERSLAVNLESFTTEIAPSRTFGFLEDVPALRAQGLALGGSLENALVLDDKGLVSGALRYPDEFVRHKILDLIGDLSLFGSPLIGHFEASKAGHSLHLKAVRFLLDNPEYTGIKTSP
jgi:UDP-3-O-[3-hydroxymyristoyl] N-acetylglucosamine deacetylase